MASEHIWVQYVPDNERSIAVLRSLIEASGCSADEVADRVGYSVKHVQAILRGKKPFPPFPEFAALVVQALPPPGSNGALTDPAKFPGYGAWRDAHPQAEAVVYRLAGCTVSDLLGKSRHPEGEWSQTARDRFRSEVAARGLKRSATYWNNVLRGHTRFPVDPHSVRIIAAVLEEMDRKQAPATFLSPGPARANLLQVAEARRLSDEEVLCLLAEEMARSANDLTTPDAAERPLRAIAHKLLGGKRPDRAIQPILTAIRVRQLRVRSLAKSAKVDPGQLARLLLGIEPLTTSNLKIIKAVKGRVRGLRKSRLLSLNRASVKRALRRLKSRE